MSRCIPLPEEARPLFGQLPEAQIAEKFEVSVSVVRRWRTEVGAAAPPLGRRRTKEKVESKKGERVVDTAALYSKRYPGIEEAVKTDPREIAVKYNVSLGTVYHIRKTYGIVSKRGRAKLSLEEHKIRAEKRYPGLIEQLGKLSDSEIAKTCGASQIYTQGLRRKLGIPPLHARTRKVTNLWPASVAKIVAKQSAKFGLQGPGSVTVRGGKNEIKSIFRSDSNGRLFQVWPETEEPVGVELAASLALPALPLPPEPDDHKPDDHSASH